jgi:putative component of membrane protein insertase Oxa1/YidC/SpoIIIJ protein YidD
MLCRINRVQTCNQFSKLMNDEVEEENQTEEKEMETEEQREEKKKR